VLCCREGLSKWSEVHASLEKQHDSLLKNHPDAAWEIEITRTALIKIRLETFGRQGRGRKGRPTQTPGR
jgi:hypothetical protein